MTTWHKGYKVINAMSRQSIVASDPRRHWLDPVTYSLLEETKPHPRAGPLTVFFDRDLADDFTTRHGWERVGTIVPCIFTLHADQDARLKGIKPNGPSMGSAFLPKGTILADIVICLE